MPSSNNRSANPITPKPIFRVARVASSISLVGYLFASTTLSRKRTASSTVSRSARQSMRSPQSFVGRRFEERGEVDRTEVAGLVGQERLFAAGIGGPNRAQVRRRVVAVHLVDEDQARVAGLPGTFHDAIPEFADRVVAVRRATPVGRHSPRMPVSFASTPLLTGVRVDHDVELGAGPP